MLGYWLMAAGMLSTCLLSDGAPPPEYTVVSLERPPLMSGAVENDPVWQSVRPECNFSVYNSGGKAAVRKTVLKAGYDNRALYIAVICLEPQMETLKTAGGDLGALWLDDSIEIFIDCGYDGFFHFIVNAAGKRYNEYRYGGYQTDNAVLAGWQAVVRCTEKNWSAEIVIPWVLLRCNPANVQTLGFNVGRNAAVIGETSSWSSLPDSFHEATAWGRLKLVPPLRNPVAGIEFTAACLRYDWQELKRHWETEPDPFYRQFRTRYAASITELEKMLSGHMTEAVLLAARKQYQQLQQAEADFDADRGTETNRELLSTLEKQP